MYWMLLPAAFWYLPGDNLLQAVKAKLGIKDSPVAPAAVPGTNKPKNN